MSFKYILSFKRKRVTFVSFEELGLWKWTGNAKVLRHRMRGAMCLCMFNYVRYE